MLGYKRRRLLSLCLTPTSSQLPLLFVFIRASPPASTPDNSPPAWQRCGSSPSPCWSYWLCRGPAPRASHRRSICAVLTWLMLSTWSVGTEASSTAPRGMWTIFWGSSLQRQAQGRLTAVRTRWLSWPLRTRWR